MDANNLILKDEVFRVVGFCFEILKEIGHGLHEKPYENALVIELKLSGIPFEQQKKFPVIYKGHSVADYIPDLIVFNQLIVDTKVIERITDHERGQMLNYLKITGHKVGLILNFKRAKLEWERIILSGN